MDLVDKLKEYSVLTDEEYKALLQTEDPLLRDKLFRGAQEAMNYDVDLDATDGWTKCRLCKAVTCSMDEWKKHTVSVPLLNEKQLVARSMIRK